MPPETDFISSWVLLWQACGGSVTFSTEREVLWHPLPAPSDRVAQVVGYVPINLNNGSEITGALKILGAMLRIGGAPILQAVSAYADVAGEA